VTLFVMTCLDHEDGLAHRMLVRDRHLAYAAQHADMVKVGGPLLDDAGQMIGSFLLMEADTRAEIEAFSAADPYRSEGVFESVTIHAFRATVGNLP
jgi:uncharacterized protein YciI